MRVLGIDPGLERLGWGVIDKTGSKLTPVAFGVLQTPRVELPSRLRLIEESLQELMGAHQPDCVATERLLFSVNKTTAMDVAKALGVVLLVTARTHLPWREYSPPEVKRAVVGNGAADKKQVQFMVTKLLGLEKPPRPDDVADALAIAICHSMQLPAVVRG